MPTNDERRKIAAELRENRDPLTPYNLVDYIFDDPWNHDSGEEVAARLADLIEPEPQERTCRMHDANWDDGQCTWGCICSKCGAKHEHERSGWMNFCPNCGARVIQD